MGKDAGQVTVALACHAMATRFELLLTGTSEPALRAAGEDALEEVNRLDRLLSLHIMTSELCGINAHAYTRPVGVSSTMMQLLLSARRAWEWTRGSFDISVAPLLRCWGFMGGVGHVPSADEILHALDRIGMAYVNINERDRTVKFERPGMQLDLGSIGKGFAIDRAIAILREHGVANCLLHGGTSTVYALGRPNSGGSWTISVMNPTQPDRPEAILQVALEDRALSVSAPHGKRFISMERAYGHVIDPRSGQSVTGNHTAVVTADRATDSDALSTGLLVSGPEIMETIQREDARVGGLIVREVVPGHVEVLRFGI